MCKISVKHYRKSILSKFSDPEFTFGREAGLRFMKKFFSHMAYSKISRPKNLESELVDITNVAVDYFQVTDDGKTITSKCEMPLAGGPISVTTK